MSPLLAAGAALFFLGHAAPQAASEDAWSRPRHVAIQGMGYWLDVEVQSKKVRRLEFPETLKPQEVVVTPSGSRVFFTADYEPAHNRLLFAWSGRSDEAPNIVGDRRGFHADPNVSDDGEWIYFAHNPDAGGQPEHHGAKAYAQIYRVRVDGTGLEALTSGQGCHFAPAAAGKSVFFVHSDCHLRRALVRLSQDTHEQAIIPEGQFEAAAGAPDGKHILFVQTEPDTYVLRELELATGTVHEVLKGMREGLPVQARYGSARTEILLLRDGHLKSFDGHQFKDIASLRRESP